MGTSDLRISDILPLVFSAEYRKFMDIALKSEPFVVGDKVVNRPRLTIYAGCGDNDELVYQLKTVRYREWRGNVTDKDAPEEPQDKRRHLVDCLKYIMLDRPRFVERQSGDDQERFNPNTVIATLLSILGRLGVYALPFA
jgi:hypothetical protein